MTRHGDKIQRCQQWSDRCGSYHSRQAYAGFYRPIPPLQGRLCRALPQSQGIPLPPMDKSVSVSQEQNCAECPGRANYEKSSCPPTLPHFHTSNPNPNPPTLQEIAQNLTLKYKNLGSALRIKMIQGFRSTLRRSIHKLTILCLSYNAWSSLGWVAEDFFTFTFSLVCPFPIIIMVVLIFIMQEVHWSALGPAGASAVDKISPNQSYSSPTILIVTIAIVINVKMVEKKGLIKHSIFNYVQSTSPVIEVVVT